MQRGLGRRAADIDELEHKRPCMRLEFDVPALGLIGRYRAAKELKGRARARDHKLEARAFMRQPLQSEAPLRIDVTRTDARPTALAPDRRQARRGAALIEDPPAHSASFGRFAREAQGDVTIELPADAPLEVQRAIAEDEP